MPLQRLFACLHVDIVCFRLNVEAEGFATKALAGYV